MGGTLPLASGLLGEDSLPGPDTTFSPPVQVTNPMASLGCLNPMAIQDLA